MRNRIRQTQCKRIASLNFQVNLSAWDLKRIYISRYISCTVLVAKNYLKSFGEVKRPSDEIIAEFKKTFSKYYLKNCRNFEEKQQTIEKYMAWIFELYSHTAVRQQLFCFRFT